MTKYIIGEIFSSGRATLYKNPSDQSVKTEHQDYFPTVCVQFTSSFVRVSSPKFPTCRARSGGVCGGGKLLSIPFQDEGERARKGFHSFTSLIPTSTTMTSM